jgi:hypothetical protein
MPVSDKPPAGAEGTDTGGRSKAGLRTADERTMIATSDGDVVDLVEQNKNTRRRSTEFL